MLQSREKNIDLYVPYNVEGAKWVPFEFSLIFIKLSFSLYKLLKVDIEFFALLSDSGQFTQSC